MSSTAVVSAMDVDHLSKIRANVSQFLKRCGQKFDGPGLLLDVAPQVHEGAAPHFAQATIETLDVDPASGATYIADLCQNNADSIPSDRYDRIVCTEVLEHVRNPFAATKELLRLLKPGGLVFVSTPFNFRIHGPLPDCWRFTEHGLRELFAEFDLRSLDAVETVDRDLMPIHYTLIAAKRALPHDPGE